MNYGELVENRFKNEKTVIALVLELYGSAKIASIGIESLKVRFCGISPGLSNSYLNLVHAFWRSVDTATAGKAEGGTRSGQRDAHKATQREVYDVELPGPESRAQL